MFLSGPDPGQEWVLLLSKDPGDIAADGFPSVTWEALMSTLFPSHTSCPLLCPWRTSCPLLCLWPGAFQEQKSFLR